MDNILKGKNILLLGGAGSVGRALTRKMLEYSPKTIRVLDISENEIFSMKEDFRGEGKIRYLIGDIRDLNRLKLAMEGVDIVVQLAAMKHVHACEYNPFEALKTNIDGLQNVIDAARSENVQKVVFASTDKAVNPTSVMGTTKLLGEKLIALANYYKGDKRTVFVSVRFGNVIGSNGSVVPLFKKQLTEGSPLTITDRGMTRFVITMDEAVDLIYGAIKYARGGETFVWKMRALKVVDLADVMIEKYAVGRETKIDIIGKYEGEKMHEEILTEDEISRGVETDDLYIVFPMIDDCLDVERTYEGSGAIKDPVIVSSHARYMSKGEIKQLIENTGV
jgi:UDP-N-acetylglucosamine 4,6-dehydratase